jgi:hypothetical protein
LIHLGNQWSQLAQPLSWAVCPLFQLFHHRLCKYLKNKAF